MSESECLLRKAGTLTVWLIIFCIYFLGVYNYVQIRNDTAVSVFLSAAYPDRKGAENILKQERKVRSLMMYVLCRCRVEGDFCERRKPAGTGDDCVS